jgi:hypothetical protein
VRWVNAGQIKNVPGRQTDVKDAAWGAQWLPHGLLPPSFVPPAIRERRARTRPHAPSVRGRGTVVNRVHTVLEDANIQLASGATDGLGKSGRARIAARIAGETAPDPLAEVARGSLRQKEPQLRRALEGRVTAHHRFLLRTWRRPEEQLEGLIAQYDAPSDTALAPFSPAAARSRARPGIGARAAEVLVAASGTDLAPFPTAGHRASWAGMCPGNDRSAGQRRSGRTTQGSQGLGSPLVQGAWAAIRTKETRFQAVYRRWVKRLGTKEALVAVGPKILTIISARRKPAVAYQEEWTPDQAA